MSIPGLAKSSTYSQKVILKPSSDSSVGVRVSSNALKTKSTVFTSSGQTVTMSPGHALRSTRYAGTSASHSALRTQLNGNSYDQGWNNQQNWNDYYSNSKYSNSTNSMNQMQMLQQMQQMMGMQQMQQAQNLNSLSAIGTGMNNLFSAIGSAKEMLGADSGKGGTQAAQSVSDMQNATDESTLSTAINKAKTREKALPAEISSKENSVKTLKDQTDGLKTTSDTAARDLKQNTDDIKTTTESVNQLQNTVSSEQSAYDSLKQQADAADEKDRPDLKTKADALKAKLDAHKQALQQKQNDLTQLKSKTEELTTKAKNAKDAYDTNVKDIKTGEEDLKKMQAEQNALKTAIPKQQERLEKLKQKDTKDLNNINKDINNLTTEITNLKNSNKTNKAQNKQEKLDKKKAEQTEIANRQDITALKPTMIGNTEFKSDASQGLYAVDGKKVGLDEFTAKKKEATLENAGIPQDIIAKGDDEISKYAKARNINVDLG